MTKFEKTFELLEASGLNWSVSKEALQTVEGKQTQSFGMFKGSDWLGTVGNIYKPFQNSELAETIVEATHDIGLQTTRGGQLSGGKKVYLQAELPSEFIGQSNVLRRITALNSHDGSTSIGFGSSSTVVICQNTFFQAYAGLAKFRHTDSAKERIELAIKDLRTALKLDTALMENFKRMADKPLKDEIFAKIIKACFETDVNAPESDLSTRKTNQLKQVAGAIETEIKLEGATLWGLFNGITRYTNHVATVSKGKPATEAEKNEYVMTGGGYKTNLVAFDTIMKWIEENSEAPALVN